MAIEKYNNQILATLNYFDIFDYPLTLIEVYKFLIDIDETGDKKENNLFILEESLNQLRRAGRVSSLNGFYFLAGRSQIAQLRLKRYQIAISKYKKAIKISQLLKFIPGIRLIAVCNNLAYNNARKGSDIDFFIITAEQRIWFVRFFCNLILSALRKRPSLLNKDSQPVFISNKQPNKQINQDKICVSFFIAENNLNLEQCKICHQDWYLMFWLQQIKPIYNQNNLYKKFVQVNSLFRNFNIYATTKFMHSRFSRVLKNILEKLVLDLDEKFYKWLQLKLMPKNLKQLAQKADSRVIIADNILKFHQNDRRLAYNQEFERRLKGIFNYSN